MKKLPRKYSGIVMGFLLPFIMIPIVSFVITYLNIGFVDNFFHKWIVAIMGGLPVAVPVAIIITPIVKGFVDRISE